MSKGKLFVISGASGVGKGTVLGIMMKKRGDLSFSVSATTRPPRPGEVDGVHYYFVTKERFEEMIARGEFLEYDVHAKNYYGTPRAQAEEKQANGPVLLDIEPNGAKQVKRSAPDAVLIFLAAPSFAELERRLTGRGDTAPEKIRQRLERARWEYTQAKQYDYIVLNDEGAHAAREIESIITAEKCKAALRLEYVKEEF